MESVAKGAPKVPDKMNTTKKKLPVLLAGFFAFASSAMSAEQTLPTPPLSEFADAESSVNVPIPTDEGRHLNLTLAFEPTPSNAVLVAFGRDLDGSETLEPEETDVIVGVDCGEVVGVGCSGSCGDVDPTATPTPTTPPTATPAHYTFALKQHAAVSRRCDLAKVTTHNLADTNLTVTAEFYSKGAALILW